MNDLMNSSQVTSQRNYSRRSTRENTISNLNIFLGNNFKKSKQMESNEEEFLLFQSYTPKFEGEEDEIVEINEEQSFNNNINFEYNTEIKEQYSKKDSIKTISSSLSLKNMKFIYEDNNTRNIKKNKTVKLGIDFIGNHNFFKKKSNSFNNNDKTHNDHSDSDSKKETNHKSKENIKYIAGFLNSINSLYKSGRINSKQKLSLKELIIKDSETIIEKFSKYNLLNNYIGKNIINNQYIKEFIMEQIIEWI